MSRTIEFVASDQMVSWIEESAKNYKDRSRAAAIRRLILSSLDFPQANDDWNKLPWGGIKLTDEQNRKLQLESLRLNVHVGIVAQSIIQLYLDKGCLSTPTQTEDGRNPS